MVPRCEFETQDCNIPGPGKNRQTTGVEICGVAGELFARLPGLREVWGLKMTLAC